MSRIPKSDPMEAKLQEMLRINIEAKGGKPLDTLADSRRSVVSLYISIFLTLSLPLSIYLSIYLSI